MPTINSTNFKASEKKYETFQWGDSLLYNFYKNWAFIWSNNNSM